ncbi:rCG43580, partial [Rattus norvegicus]
MSPQPGAFPLSERRSVRMIGTLVLPVHPLPSLQPPALDSRRKENSALRGGILRKDQQRASSPVVGSRKWGSAFGLAPCPELSFITEVFPLTINIETYLFAWVYSPSFVHSLVPPNCSPCEGLWNAGSLASHPGPLQRPHVPPDGGGGPNKDFAKC